MSAWWLLAIPMVVIFACAFALIALSRYEIPDLDKENGNE